MQYDFIDFGCSEGGSIKEMSNLFGATGIGYDNSQGKVNKARANGHAAEVADLTKLEINGQFRFATMIHFLEHLPGRNEALGCIRSACKAVTEFVYIKQPWFDSDGYLFLQGLKMYSSDWTGHTYHMTSLNMQTCLRKMMEEGLITRFGIYAHRPVNDSSHIRIHPLSSPIDQKRWNEKDHSPKPDIPLFKTYLELGAIAVKNRTILEELESIIGLDEKIFDSDSNLIS